MRGIFEHLDGKSHVIWDWNGTLLADVDHAVSVVNQLLSEQGLQTMSVNRYKLEFGFPVVDFYQRLGFDTAPEHFSFLCERFNDLFEAGLSACDLWPDARETLASIKSRGLTQSVLSASEQSMLNRAVKRFNVDHLFDHVVGIADKRAGSKVEFGRQLLKSAGAPAAKCVLIGDTDHDVEVARELGIDIVLVDHGHQCPTRFKALTATWSGGSLRLYGA